MKNLVYLCCFLNQQFFRLLELFFASVSLFSRKSLDSTDILIITHEDFVGPIQSIASSFDIPVLFFIVQKPYNVFISTTQRYFLFSWNQIQNYQKVLYLDTDILIHGELTELFSKATDPTKLYTLREGTISHEFWGGDEIFDFHGIDSDLNPKTPGFCTGVMLFYSHPEIAALFDQANDFMLKKIQVPGSKWPICFDQPYVNYVCAKGQKNENSILEKFCINRADHLHQGFIVYHFPATSFGKKYKHMILMILEMVKPFNSSSSIETLVSCIQKGTDFLQNYNEHEDPYKKF